MNNKGALSNIKVIDLTTLLPGPYATLMMADMGADVLKISSPSKVDLVLEKEPFLEDTNKSANLLWLNRNKKTMALNLKTAEGIEILKELVKDCDVLVEQFRPGVMKKLGLSYEKLSKINPGLIYCSISSYGQTGPMSTKAGHDINFLAKSGIMSLSGKKDIGPILTNTQIGDLAIGANNAIIGILAALNYKNMTGEGQYIDISMLDGLVSYNTFDGAAYLVDNKEQEREEGMLNGGCAYDFYRTSDGRHLSVGSLEPKFWKAFCEAINRPEFINKTVCPEDVRDMKDEIQKTIASKTYSQWKEIFKDLDCCVEPVQNLQEALFEDEHIKARELVIEMPVEDKKVMQFAMPIKFSKSKAEYKFVGKNIGEDTISTMKNLGYSDEEIQNLKNKDVFK